ncbi:DUF2975 domain-containing protein [Niabella beijingensis]|uniref:DUF2975 domain-containing protein n=1 Tax=Niabella beijingensis TaxID=2872700 RepID=UPI001CBC1B23|nr:DUF2975 domain-containing protein [Niabella beijingensis]MBZ4188551.1 DUF2975 domain-containing protein [Niabella beijingensis]
MTLKITITVLKIIIRIGFYLLLLIIVFFLVISALKLSGVDIDKNLNPSNAVTVRAFGNTAASQVITNEKQTGFYQQISSYLFQPYPNTPAGYYLVFIRTVYLFISLAILGLLLRILKTISKAGPFHLKIIRLLRLLALVFIANELVGIMDYLVMRSILDHQFPAMRFRPEMHFGDDLITGLIIFVIAFVYARGVELQQEQEFTI